MSSTLDWFGCPYDHCGFEGPTEDVEEHVALRHDPNNPKWDGYPDSPDWWLR